MENLFREEEVYIKKKLAHLLFEILEYHGKRDILYLPVCYCQLLRRWKIHEIPLVELKNCLSKYWIDVEGYPFGDFLLELEFLLLKEGNEGGYVDGRNLITRRVTGEGVIGFNPRYSPFIGLICDKIFRYWYFTKNHSFLYPRDGRAVIQNAILLYNGGLYAETLHYLEYYLPYVMETDEVLMFRVLNGLARIGVFLEENYGETALIEVRRLRSFIKDFKRELKAKPYDFGKLYKELASLEKELKRGKGRDLIPPPLEIKKRKTFGGWLIKLLKGLPIFRLPRRV